MSNFQIVRTDAGWHARWRAANGEPVWWTEVYESPEAAQQAIVLITSPEVAAEFATNYFAGVDSIDERGTEE